MDLSERIMQYRDLLMDIDGVFDVRRSKYGEYASYPSIIWGERGFDGLIGMMDFVSRHFDSDKKNRTFFDFGSGEGVVIFLANLYGFNTYGFEHHDSLVEYSKKLENHICVNSRSTICQGDWRNIDSYNEMGVGFKDFDFLYIYPSSNRLQLAYNLIKKESESGTILAVKQSSEDDVAILPDCLSKLIKIDCDISPINIYVKK